MGVLANLAAALFPDYNSGTNTPHSPSMADLRTFAGAIDNSIPNAQDLSGLSVQVGQAYAFIDQANKRIDALSTASAAVSAHVSEVFNDLHASDIRIDAVQQAASKASDQLGEAFADIQASSARIDAVEKTADAKLQDLQETTAGLATSLDASSNRLTGLQRTLFRTDRPGDAPDLFTTDLASGIAGVPPNAVVVTSDVGQVLRITGSAVLAPVALTPVEPGRLYKLRAVFSRSRDPIDPAGDAVRFAVAWYGPDSNLLLLGCQDLGTIDLTVARGRVVAAALVAQAPATSDIVAAPAGTVFCRPALLTFGPDGVTDLVSLAAIDVSDLLDLSI